jgi:hypothetical protein
MLFSFVAGALVVFPFFVFSRKKSKKASSVKQTIIGQKDSSTVHHGAKPGKASSRRPKNAPYDPYNPGND